MVDGRSALHATRLVIYGRDGILNEYRTDHVKAPEEWVPVRGALEALARLNHAGWHAVVATNQSGIGRGLIDMATVNAVHAHMNRLLMAAGGRIDAVFFCPHAPEVECDCRKPLPGMMFDIGRRYGVDLAQVPMVADTLRDLLPRRPRAASRIWCSPGARPRSATTNCAGCCSRCRARRCTRTCRPSRSSCSSASTAPRRCRAA